MKEAAQWQAAERIENTREKHLRMFSKGWGEVVQELEQIPLQPLVKTIVKEVVLLQPMVVNSAVIHPAAY